MILEALPKPFFVLAPMDGVTDTVFRQIIVTTAKPDLFVTEFVNVDGLQSPGRGKLLHKLKFSAKEKPIIAQVWGKNPENFYKTTKELKKMGFGGIDLNFGCPVKAVVKNGCGAALISNRELAGEIIEQVREMAGDQFPISVKTRLGFDAIDLSWVEFLLKQKLNMLTIHGRTAKELSKTPANWEMFDKIRQMRDKISPSTLIVGNGDVISRAHGLKLAAQYKLDGIMIGRAVFSDPFVFTRTVSRAGLWNSYTKAQKLDLYKKHVRLFDKTYKNNELSIKTLNKFCKMYVSGFEGAKELRERLMKAQNMNELITMLK